MIPYPHHRNSHFQLSITILLFDRYSRMNYLMMMMMMMMM